MALWPTGIDRSGRMGGIVRVDGQCATLADGSRWWLNQWAVAEAIAQAQTQPEPAEVLMARMLGRIGRRRFTCLCCDWSRTPKQVRAAENRQWRREAAHA